MRFWASYNCSGATTVEVPKSKRLGGPNGFRMGTISTARKIDVMFVAGRELYAFLHLRKILIYCHVALSRKVSNPRTQWFITTFQVD
jgi:hypothetical protein